WASLWVLTWTTTRPRPRPGGGRRRPPRRLASRRLGRPHKLGRGRDRARQRLGRRERDRLAPVARLEPLAGDERVDRLVRERLDAHAAAAMRTREHEAGQPGRQA